MVVTYDGIVLREIAVGDYDKIIVLLTHEKGLISVSAKGAKNMRSDFMAATQQFSYGSYTLYCGRKYYRLNEVTLKESFFRLRLNIEALALACYMAELASELVPEQDSDSGMLSLLLNTLYLLVIGERPPELLKGAYEMRALSLSGFRPDFVACTDCGKFESEHMYLMPSDGVIYCEECFKKLSEKPHDAIRISPDVVYAIRYVLFSEDKRVFSFALHGSALKEFTTVCEKYMLAQMEHTYNTLEYYKKIKNAGQSDALASEGV